MATVDRDETSITGWLSKDEWRALSEIRPWPIVRAAVGTWLCILAAIGFWCVYPTLLTFVVALIVVGARQHALNNLVHEAAHYSITRDKALNDWISDVCFATPHLISTNAYRQKHALHHSGLGDPHKDTEIKPRYVIRGIGFLKHSVRALSGLAAVDAASEYAPSAGTGHPWRYYPLVLITNAALFGYCLWLGRPEAYLLLWLLPLFTVAMLISTLRAIAEHQPSDYAHRGVEDFTSRMPRFTRSIASGPVERFFFGPVNFCYHQEHHLAPGIPFPNLPALHRLLRQRGYFDEQDDRIGQTYVGTLLSLAFNRAPADTKAGS